MAVDIDPQLLDLDRELSELDNVALLRLASQQRNALHQALQEIRRLEERKLQLEALYFGRKSERRRHDVPGQSTLFGVPITPEEEESTAEANDGSDGSGVVATDPAPPTEAATTAAATKAATGNAGKAQNGGGRKPVSSEMPTVETTITVNDELRCDVDGTPLDTTGWETTMVTHYERGRCVRLIIRREKLGRATTGETIVRAPVPERIVARGKLTDPLIIELAVQKFYKGIPLARTLIELNAACCELSSSLASDAMRHLGRFLQPIAGCVRDAIFAEPFLHVDETPISYQIGSGRTATRKQGYFIIVVAGKQCFTEFVTSRSGYHIARTLALQDDTCANRDPPDDDDDGDGDGDDAEDASQDPPTRPYIGYLVVDGYAGYNGVVGAEKAIRVACNVHALRYFKRAARTNSIAAAIVESYQRLFAVEREARRFIARHKVNGPAADAHFAAERDCHSRGLWQTLRAQIETAALGSDPASALGRACAYFFNRYDDLTVYLDHGFLPMDNNAAERSIRPITVGRKNYQFVGSVDAGHDAAALYTLMESCRLLKLDPWAYLTWVVGTIHRARVQGQEPDYAACTPRAAKRTVREWIKARRQLPSDQLSQPFLGL